MAGTLLPGLRIHYPLLVFALAGWSGCSVGLAQVSGIESGKATEGVNGDRISVRSTAVDVTYAKKFGPVELHGATGVAAMKAHRRTASSAQRLTGDAIFRGGLGASMSKAFGMLHIGGYAGVVYNYQRDEFYEEDSTAPTPGLAIEGGIELSIPDLNRANSDRFSPMGPMLRLTLSRQTYETDMMNGPAKFNTLGIFATFGWVWHLGDDE